MRCIVCGAEFEPNDYVPEVAERLSSEHMCHSCDFWNMQHELDRDGSRMDAVIGGMHYVIHPYVDGKVQFGKGMGGNTVYVRFKDGRIVRSDNVWCQGEVPERFLDMFPDNAEFITAEAYERSISE